MIGDTESQLKEERQWLKGTFSADAARLESSFPPSLIKQIRAARQEKVLNKRREKERELKGEVLRRTVERARKSVPSYLLHKLSTEQRKLDQIARSSISEVGYVGHAKKMRGWNLKEDPWAKEDGPASEQERLAAAEEKIVKENLKRRTEWERDDEGQSSG